MPLYSALGRCLRSVTRDEKRTWMRDGEKRILVPKRGVTELAPALVLAGVETVRQKPIFRLRPRFDRVIRHWAVL